MKTVTAKTDRSGWDKRQASLILYIFANGVLQLLPKLIFYRKLTEESSKIKEQECHLYYLGVTVYINNTVYNNEELMA